MTRPWLLVAAGGVTVGALGGLPGVFAWVVLVCVVALPGRGGWLALVAVAAIAASVGAARVALDDAPPLPTTVVESTAAEVTVRSVPQSGPSGPRAVVQVDRIEVEPAGWQPAAGEVLVLFRDNAPERLAKGDRLRVRWTVSAGDSSGFGRFVRSSGVTGWASVYWSSVIERGRNVTSPITGLREHVTRRIGEAVPGDAGALIAGFVTGDDAALSRRARHAFERTGMAHITAVSGSNVAVLLTIWFFIFRTGRHKRSLPVLVGVTLVIWLYVLLVGMGPGAVRAGLMASIMVPAARLGRRPDALTALVTASALMVMVQPSFAGNVGFWLSLAASGAIVVVLGRGEDGWLSGLRRGVLALVGAQLATLPIIVWVFGAWSPSSLLANLVVGPMVSFAFPCAFVLALVVSVAPWMAALVGWLPGLVTTMILAVVDWIATDAVMLRLGVASTGAIILLAVMAAAVIGLMSGESRRWLARVARRFPESAQLASVAAFGVGLGVWLAVIVGSIRG